MIVHVKSLEPYLAHNEGPVDIIAIVVIEDGDYLLFLRALMFD